MALVHKDSKLQFSIKSGEVRFVQQEKYITESNDETIDKFKGECPLDSENLTDWAENVVTSWLNGASIRDDATAG